MAAKSFSQRLKEAVARYHANAISTVKMIQELIALTRDVKASASRGEEQGLTPEELAFYDALAENESAVEVMESKQLRGIAHKLVEEMRTSATVDWHHKEAVQTVLARAEVMLREVSSANAPIPTLGHRIGALLPHRTTPCQ